MAFKLGPDKRLEAYCNRDEAMRRSIGLALDIANKQLTAVNSLISEYNELIVEFNGYMEDIHSDHREKFDGYSDKWQDGDRGQAVLEWLNELEMFGIEEVPELDIAEFLDIDLVSFQDELNELKEEPDEV